MTGQELRINEEVLRRAQQMDRGALESLVESVYPALCRIAYGLSGRADVGRGVVRFVINHSLQQVQHWSDTADARRWFYHFTILVARRGLKHEPKAQQDTLVENSGEVSAAYIAFVRGMRALPFQQREAYLLTWGENLSPRDTATAMDCSTSAVAVHLQGAEQLLRPMAGDAYEGMKDRLSRAYANLAPRDEMIQPSVHRLINRLLWPRRIKRIVTIIIAAAILIGLAFAYWRFRDRLWPHTNAVPSTSTADTAVAHRPLRWD